MHEAKKVPEVYFLRERPVRPELKQKITEGVVRLQMLRDEVRLKVHLANMDAKDEWTKLEQKIAEAERLANKASRDVESLIEELVTRIQSLNASLR